MHETNRQRRMLTPGNLLLGLAGFLFLLCFSVVLVLNLRSIYYFDVRYLDLAEKTGYSESVIRENYDALIDYNLITNGDKELELPSFPVSEHGAIHFKEVKNIFVAVQILCIVSGIVLLLGMVRKLPRKEYGFLKLICILTFVIPVALGICAAVNWEGFFVQFHKLFFRNNYWLFDPVTDPVILILPDEFFAHCVAAILLFLLLGGVLTGALYRLLTRKYRRQRAAERGQI